MPDLWKALGDVYGDADPDGPSVAVERPASARPLDDDLAAALSAALVNAPAPPPPPAAPAPPPAPPASPAAPVPPAAPVAPVTAPAPAPVKAVKAVKVAGPAEPAVSPVPPVGAQHRVAEWVAEIEQRQEL